MYGCKITKKRPQKLYVLVVYCVCRCKNKPYLLLFNLICLYNSNSFSYLCLYIPNRPRLFVSIHFLPKQGLFSHCDYFTSIWREAFSSFFSIFGRSMVSTPSLTLAAIFSLSTSSGSRRVCSNFEYENSRRR